MHVVDNVMLRSEGLLTLLCPRYKSEGLLDEVNLSSHCAGVTERFLRNQINLSIDPAARLGAAVLLRGDTRRNAQYTAKPSAAFSLLRRPTLRACASVETKHYLHTVLWTVRFQA